jgi:hypothetical protein
VSPAVYIVFSRRPRGVPEQQYDRWYERYVSQVLAVPGFVTAARYDVVPALDEPAEPDRFTSAAVYEIEGSTLEAMAALARLDLPGSSVVASQTELLPSQSRRIVSYRVLVRVM